MTKPATKKQQTNGQPVLAPNKEVLTTSVRARYPDGRVKPLEQTNPHRDSKGHIIPKTQQEPALYADGRVIPAIVPASPKL